MLANRMTRATCRFFFVRTLDIFGCPIVPLALLHRLQASFNTGPVFSLRRISSKKAYVRVLELRAKYRAGIRVQPLTQNRRIDLAEVELELEVPRIVQVAERRLLPVELPSVNRIADHQHLRRSSVIGTVRGILVGTPPELGESHHDDVVGESVRGHVFKGCVDAERKRL